MRLRQYLTTSSSRRVDLFETARSWRGADHNETTRAAGPSSVARVLYSDNRWRRPVDKEMEVLSRGGCSRGCLGCCNVTTGWRVEASPLDNRAGRGECSGAGVDEL